MTGGLGFPGSRFPLLCGRGRRFRSALGCCPLDSFNLCLAPSLQALLPLFFLAFLTSPFLALFFFVWFSFSLTLWFSTPCLPLILVLGKLNRKIFTIQKTIIFGQTVLWCQTNCWTFEVPGKGIPSQSSSTPRGILGIINIWAGKPRLRFLGCVEGHAGYIYIYRTKVCNN